MLALKLTDCVVKVEQTDSKRLIVKTSIAEIVP
jgi:hypothetical protein